MEPVQESPPECRAEGCHNLVERAKTGTRAGQWKYGCSESCSARYRYTKNGPVSTGVDCCLCSRPISVRTLARNGGVNGGLTAHPSCIEQLAKEQTKKKKVAVLDTFTRCRGCSVNTNLDLTKLDGYHSTKCKAEHEKQLAAEAADDPDADRENFSGYNESEQKVAIAKIAARCRESGDVGPSVKLLMAVDAVRESM